MSLAPTKNENQAATEQPVYTTPAVDVESTKDGYVLHAEMAGVDKSGIEVTVDNGDLILIGRRSSLTVNGQPLHRERRAADYRRVYEIVPSIDTGRITARIDQGVLTVTLPKAEAVKPRRIALQ